MDNKPSFEKNGRDREIDLRQLGVIVLSKWKIILICMVLGLGGGLVMLHRAMNVDMNKTIESTEDYKKQSAEYDQYKAVYDNYIEQIEMVLDEGIPDTIPEGSSRLEQAWYLSQIMLNLNQNKAYIDAYKEPSKQDDKAGIGMGTVVKSLAAGVLAGIFVAVLGLLSFVIFSDIVLSAYELGQRYGVRVLAVLSDDKKKRWFASGRDGFYLRKSGEEQIKSAVAKIKAYDSRITQIVVTGSIEERILTDIANRLKSACAGLNVSVLTELYESDMAYANSNMDCYVVIVERILGSRYGIVDNEMDILSFLNKSAIGIIGVYGTDL